jgi:putative acetyltransferase
VTSTTVTIRSYEAGDAPALARLFYETVHAVNRGDYSPEQLQAWAPEVPDSEAWHARMSGRCTLVAEKDDEAVGFAELERDGHLDMLYLRKDAVGRGVGSRLYLAVEQVARKRGLGRIFTEATIMARPLFERQGSCVVGEQAAARRGARLTNFAMEKSLQRPDEGADRRTY